MAALVAWLAAGCADVGPTAPEFKPPTRIDIPPGETPCGWYEYCPPSTPYDAGPLLDPAMLRQVPAEVFDLVAQVATTVRDDPTQPESERAHAAQLLARLPSIREATSAGYGMVAASAADLGGGMPSLEADPCWFDPQYGYVCHGDRVVAAFTTAARTSGAIFAPRPGFPGWFAAGPVTSPATGYSAGGVDCKKELWGWAKASFEVAASVWVAAGGAYTIYQSGGILAGPGLKMLAGGIAGLAASSVDLYFAQDELMRCVEAANRRYLVP